MIPNKLQIQDYIIITIRELLSIKIQHNIVRIMIMVAQKQLISGVGMKMNFARSKGEYRIQNST
jgi:hypothetical protein